MTTTKIITGSDPDRSTLHGEPIMEDCVVNEINWDVLWAKFELWHSDEERKRRREVCDACGMRSSYAPDPEWEEQQKKIAELVSEALK